VSGRERERERERVSGRERERKRERLWRQQHKHSNSILSTLDKSDITREKGKKKKTSWSGLRLDK
jgi:hypothetical protein